ncbi:MAG TPA: lysine--tRNA ligase, partial [Candidatus Saccharimonadales bacterium]|nr:lysine--tRNA ligase [Candidatus Saccharimonadales bacterium]
YEDKNGTVRTTSYAGGEVKLDWRLDWPGRWWLLDVGVEPFGRDHATKGGSYDTGKQIMKDVYGAPAPLPVPYDFVNLAGDTKKMSASRGTGLDALGVVKVLPPEIVRYFMLRFSPSKRLYFDPENGVSQLMDDFAELLAKADKTAEDKRLIAISMGAVPNSTVSSVPFSHLVASYQSALKDADKTLEIIRRTEHKKTVDTQEDTIRSELKFIDSWLKNWAPDDVKFELADKPPKLIGEPERQFLLALSKAVQQAPAEADGEWFHKAVYDLQSSSGLLPKQLFSTLYQALIGQDHGPRAGWFLSILPRDWLIKRLNLEA